MGAEARLALSRRKGTRRAAAEATKEANRRALVRVLISRLEREEGGKGGLSCHLIYSRLRHERSDGHTACIILVRRSPGLVDLSSGRKRIANLCEALALQKAFRLGSAPETRSYSGGPCGVFQSVFQIIVDVYIDSDCTIITRRAPSAQTFAHIILHRWCSC